MGIGTSEGEYYEDELTYQLGQPSLKITVNKPPEIESQPLEFMPYDRPGGEITDQERRYGLGKLRSEFNRARGLDNILPTEKYDDGPTWGENTRRLFSEEPDLRALKVEEADMETSLDNPSVHWNDIPQNLPRKINDFKPADTSDWSPALKVPNKSIYDYRKLTPEQQQDTLRGYAVDWSAKTKEDIQRSVEENGSLRMGSDHPGLMELRKNLPDHLEIIDLHEWSAEEDVGKDGYNLPDGSGWARHDGMSSTTSVIRVKQSKLLVSQAGDDNIVGQGGPIETEGMEAFRSMLDAFETQRATEQGVRNPPQGSMEREGRNTYNREIRRSPADGTFRTEDQMRFHWDEFTTPREIIRNIQPVTQEEADAEDLRQRPWTEADQNRSYPIANENQAPRLPKDRGRIDFEVAGNKGTISYVYDPNKKNIHIGWMGSADMSGDIKPHQLGADKVMNMMKALALAYPDAETFSALRISGARRKVGNAGATNRLVIRQIPRELLAEQPDPQRVPLPAPPSATAAPSATNRMPGLPRAGLGGTPGTNLTDLY